VAVFCALLLLVNSALAEPQEWMKKENPGVLATVVVNNGCPDSEETYRNAVAGVLVRSRIRPVESVNEVDGYFYLQAELLCYEIPEVAGRYAASVSVTFGRVSVPIDIAFPRRRWMMGTNSRDSVLDGLIKRTEAAISDYLKANFDLQAK